MSRGEDGKTRVRNKNIDFYFTALKDAASREGRTALRCIKIDPFIWINCIGKIFSSNRRLFINSISIAY